MATDLDSVLRSAVREEVRVAVREAFEEVELEGGEPDRSEDWKSRIHRVHPNTRLSLGEAAEALDVSKRTVRRYTEHNGDRPPLPSRKGPTGLTVRAGDLVTWIEDIEEAERFRAAGGRP